MDNQIQRLDEIFNKIESLESIIKSIGLAERLYLSREIISKLKVLISDTINANDLLSKYATLRYILETMINVKLLNLEETYTFILYYSIFSVQVEKTKKFISRIDQEIEIAKKYDEREKKETAELMNKIDLKADSKIYLEELNKITVNIDLDSDYESVIFWDDYKNNGYAFTAHLIETKIKSEYQTRLNELTEKLNKVKTQLYKNNKINLLFGFTSEEDVYVKLKDKRRWVDKADAVGLSNDYQLIYDLSSSIIHSTVYSLFTDNDLNVSDNQLVNNLIVRYNNNIINELKAYLSIDKLDMFVCIDLTEE
ncbi:MAG: hypothetical protein ACOYMA_15525 [Bacteroidia bacterium]